MNIPEGVGHASLVSQEGCEVDWLAGDIFGPRAHPPNVRLASLVGQKPQVPVAWCMEFTMRLEKT